MRMGPTSQTVCVTREGGQSSVLGWRFFSNCPSRCRRAGGADRRVNTDIEMINSPGSGWSKKKKWAEKLRPHYVLPWQSKPAQKS